MKAIEREDVSQGIDCDNIIGGWCELQADPFELAVHTMRCSSTQSELDHSPANRSVRQ